MSNERMILPAVALRGITILPGMVTHFDISRDRSLRAVEKAMEGDRKIFLVTQCDINVEDPGIEDLYSIGVVAEVKQIIRMQNKIVRVVVTGTNRGRLEYFVDMESYLKAEVLVFTDDVDGELPEKAQLAMVESLQ